MKRLILAISAGSLALAGGATLAGCSSGSSAPVPPPTALSVLQSDGYTTNDGSLSANQLNTALGSASGDLSSGSAGSNTSGNAEVVLIMTPAGETAISAAGGASAIQALVPNGITVTINGDILRMDGTSAAIAQLGNTAPSA